MSPKPKTPAQISPDHRLIAKLYFALTKEHWEEGPTYSEAVDAAHNWFWNNYDESQYLSASDGLRCLARPRKEAR